MAGIGVDWWSREIKAGVDEQNNQVSGYEETYRIIYAKAGLGIVETSLGNWSGRLEVGTKLPLSTEEKVSSYSKPLNPGRKASIYAQYQATRKTASSHYSFTVYYESYRFAASPRVQTNKDLMPPAGNDVILQPESDMDVIGLRFGYYL